MHLLLHHQCCISSSCKCIPRNRDKWVAFQGTDITTSLFNNKIRKSGISRAWGNTKKLSKRVLLSLLPFICQKYPTSFPVFSLVLDMLLKQMSPNQPFLNGKRVCSPASVGSVYFLILFSFSSSNSLMLWQNNCCCLSVLCLWFLRLISSTDFSFSGREAARHSEWNAVWFLETRPRSSLIFLST